MCISAGAMMAIGAGISAVSAIQQGQQAQAMGNYQAEQANADAQASKADAELQAAEIRKAGMRQRSSAVAAQAASGVTIDSGSAELINNEITRNSEKDALTTILSGNLRSRQLVAKGQSDRIAGDNAMTAGYLNAGASALRAGAVLKGWRA